MMSEDPNIKPFLFSKCTLTPFPNTEINTTEYDSSCKQRHVLSYNSHRNCTERAPLKKLIDRCLIPPYLFLSREDDDDDVRAIGKHDFRSVLCHSLLSNANRFDAYEKKKVANLRFDLVQGGDMLRSGAP